MSRLTNLALPWWKAPRHAAAPASAGLSLHATAATPDTAAPVHITGLSLRYGNAGPAVLNGLDWRLQPGQVVGLLGRNGAGKTSLLEALLGLREPLAGEVRLFGQPATAIDDTVRARIGYVPQQNDLFEGLTATEMLAYFRSFYPRWNEARVNHLLQRWQLPTDQPIGRLSGGQQQRLAIIRALAHEPELLVLDEPVASLDPLARRDFLRELVEQVLDRGTTVVFSTHILSDLERVAFNVAFLQAGRIRLQAPLDELLEECQWLSGPPAALQAAGGEFLAQVGGRTLVRGAAAHPGVQAQGVTLEDLFEALT
ncbi:ABC transporter ATP-binding protein [Inhella gelatinilytica]|uniref:ABC transporter ATP-binding protein n=1 Tax=Inhella gelatinilytica TaxID=2795030 RepID=A0A931J180_9BURK|nr:ABC transporter ATP-binding protein [Inhella gelatinilytica]MBH9553643.1 ABC transporter ATP-binding protein [Inhella gelatinilytica]